MNKSRFFYKSVLKRERENPIRKSVKDLNKQFTQNKIK